MRIGQIYQQVLDTSRYVITNNIRLLDGMTLDVSPDCVLVVSRPKALYDFDHVILTPAK
jgi:hypothetical protein